MNNTLNFRDCGGCPTHNGKQVRTGLLYRSGSFDRINARNRRLVLSARLKTMIDLRPVTERPARRVQFTGVRRLELPFDIEGITRQRILPFLNKRNGVGQLIAAVESVYRDIVSLVAEPLQQLFDYLVDANAYPLCINCRAGKDRTGYVVAIILRSLDVAPDDIVRDYLATNQSILPQAQRITRPVRIISFGLLPTRTWEAAITAHECYIRSAFTVIDNRYGGIDGYISFCGITENKRKQLRELLCEDVDQ